MARFEKGNKLGNRFSKDNQPENSGRKPKIFTVLKKRYGIDLAGNGAFTQDQIQDLLQSLLTVDMRQTTTLHLTINHDIKKIVEDLKSGKMPNINKNEVVSQVFVALSQAINKEMAKGESYTIRWIIEYLYGKAIQPVESDVQVTNNSAVDLSALTTDELLQYNNLLEKIKAGNGAK